MRFKDSLDIVLTECRFIPDERSLSSLLPEVHRFLPPLSAIRYTDGRSPRFSWGFPVVHGRRLLGQICGLFAEIAGKVLQDPGYQEKLHNLTPDQLKDDAYFRAVSDLLTHTLAEGAFLKLDSIFWIYLLDVLGRRLDLDDGLSAFIKASLPDDQEALLRHDHALIRMRYREPERLAGVRNQILRSFFARHEYAVSCMKEIFDEIPKNPLARAMVDHRFVFTERPDSLYKALNLDDALRIKAARHSSEDFKALNSMLVLVIEGILRRRASGQLLPPDAYFLQLADLERAFTKGLTLPTAAPGEEGARSDVERIASWLSLQEEPSRYLLYHMGELAKIYLKPVEKQVDLGREVIRGLRSPVDRVVIEEGYQEISRDLKRWDFFNVLRSKITWVEVKGDEVFAEGRPVADTTVPLNLDAYHEVYRRSRHGTAVFFDLIGFTDKTKALSKRPEDSRPGRGEEKSRFSFMSLAIQRLFSVRAHLERLGGEPQGFEGDAILDIFPRALNALRYVAMFADNYDANRTLKYRPFERPATSPYQDGWRVGLASGDYTVISIVGRTNEMSPDAVHERAVGHTVNRASRLNSGKKGAQGFLLDEPDAGGAQGDDPLGVMKVRVDRKRQLTNNGICAFEDTFQEVMHQVKEERLPWYEPQTGRGGLVRGLRPTFNHYKIDLIFDEPKLDKIFLAMPLPIEPELKGLEDERRRVYELLMMTPEAFTAFCEKEARLDAAAVKLEEDGPPFEFGSAEGEGEGGGWLSSVDEPDPYAEASAFAPSLAALPHDPGPGFGAPSAVRLARLKQVEDKGIPPAALIGREERLLKPEEAEVWRDAERAPPPAAPRPPAASGAAASGALAAPPPAEGRALPATPPPAEERALPATAIPAAAASAEADGGAPWEDPPESDGLSLPERGPSGALDAALDTATGLGAVGSGGGSRLLGGAVRQGVGGARRVAEALAFVGEDMPGEGGGISLSLHDFDPSGGELEGDSGGFVDPFAGSLSLDLSALPAALPTAAPPPPRTSAAPEPPEPSPSPTAAPVVEPVGGGDGPQTPAAAGDGGAPSPPTSPARPRPGYDLDRYDVDGYGYVLIEGDGEGQPPTAILVGCPRQDVLQDCHRYEANEFPPGQWSLDAALGRFVYDLAEELGQGQSRSAEPLPPGAQVYLLDPAWLVRLFQGS